MMKIAIIDDDWKFNEFNKAFVRGDSRRVLGKLTANSIIGRLLDPLNDNGDGDDDDADPDDEDDGEDDFDDDGDEDNGDDEDDDGFPHTFPP